MKPQLVDYGNAFQKDQLLGIKKVVKIENKANIKQIGNFNFFFNLIGLITLVVGGVILYYRKINKETMHIKYFPFSLSQLTNNHNMYSL